jgi:hypothetical protein
MAVTRLTATLRDIGHAAYLWNRIQEAWFLIFTCLLKDVPLSAAEAIFRQFDSDRAQRELVLAVADAMLDAKDPKRVRIGQLCAKTNDESGYRNSLLHAKFHLTVEPNYMDLRVGKDGSSKRLNKFEFAELKTELPNFLTRLKALDRDLEELRRDMAGMPRLTRTFSDATMLAMLLQREAEGKFEIAVDPADFQGSAPPVAPSGA